ncbi:beta-propeller domain-containing protein [Krasilnikovia sp. MM14-A1259]|uniref:beta-propeller domain-containing protein n=1 Tax=Krasilnikovia sp. MM14-A1259 TaxID=3373539 RepID=UPI0038082AB5
MPAPRWTRLLLCGALAATAPLTGCTAQPTPPRPTGTAAAGSLRLVAFDSCDQLLNDLRTHAKKAVGPWGFPGSGGGRPEVLDMGGARTAMKDAAPVPAAAAPHSTTNNHEQDADEPDIVKTDGRRIVTVSNGTLRVVDAASRTVTGRLDLGVNGETELLLAGDSALVLARAAYLAGEIDHFAPPMQTRAQLVLVDLRGTPRVVSRYTGDGALVDARQTGTVARVVLRSTPAIALPQRPDAAEDDRIAANRKAVGQAPLGAWLPDWSVTTGADTTSGQVGCDRVSRPADFSGTSLVTVLTFDLTAPALTDGDPVTVAADADTVYGTGTSLYLAGDQRWRLDIWPGRAPKPTSVPQHTDIYRLELTGAERPRYASAGSVPGQLVNQYALSEWDGHLRVATTDDNVATSAVRVLEQRGGTLTQVGVVDGLGHGERIYSVRFIGPRGYLVTFRQTDPLYAVDLADPAHPAVTGELKITGYSAHLQPVGDGRIVGVGQEADTAGRVSGTQVSLFDTSNPAQPRRLAQRHIAGGQSEAEWDPHALLWWPATQLLVVPVTTYDPRARTQPDASALALRVTDTGLTEVGAITQPRVADGTAPTVRRTLVVGDVLWTMSDSGLQASNLSTMDRLAWLPNG